MSESDFSARLPGPGDGPAPAAVVEQRVDGLLEHPLLVVDDDLGCAEVEQSLQPVVAVDDAAVQVVEVGGREAATVELHHRPQVGRDHRDDVEDHAHRRVDRTTVVVAAVERGHDLQALDRLRLALALGRRDRLLEVGLHDLEVEARHEVLDRLGAHAAREVLVVAVDELTPHALVVDELLRLERPQRVPHELEVTELLFVPDPDVLEVLVLGLLGPLELVLLRVSALELLELGDVHLVALAQLDVALALDVADLGAHLGLERRQVLVQALGVDPRDQVRGEVDDLLERLRRDVEQVAEPARDALEVPDVRDRRGQLDVTHPLAAHLGARDLDAAALADDALEADALVLAAVALPVLRRTEDLLAEESVLLGLERAVVDRLGLLHLAVGPGEDVAGSRQVDGEAMALVHVEHVMTPLIAQ